MINMRTDVNRLLTIRVRKAHETFRDHLVVLYTKVIIFQESCFYSYSKHTVKRYLRDVVSLDDWAKMLAEVQAAKADLVETEKLFQDWKVKYKREVEKGYLEQNKATNEALSLEVSRIGMLKDALIATNIERSCLNGFQTPMSPESITKKETTTLIYSGKTYWFMSFKVCYASSPVLI